MNKTFACNTNAGANKLVASFVPRWTYSSVISIEGRVGLTFTGGSLNDAGGLHRARATPVEKCTWNPGESRYR